MIQGAPWSFVTVCLLCGGAIWWIVNSIYSDKVNVAKEQATKWHDTSDRWQSDASYWEDIAKRPVVNAPQSTPSSQPVPASQAPPVKESKGNAKPSGEKATVPKPTRPAVIAPNGVAIGGDNNGSATVNNFAPPQRAFTAHQRSLFDSLIGPAPTEGFDGVYCIWGDQEGHQFAQQIWDALKQNGWPVGMMVGQQMLDRTQIGLFIAVSPEDAASPPDGVLRAFNALRNAGFLVTGMRLNGTPRGHWHILVGNQPTS